MLHHELGLANNTPIAALYDLTNALLNGFHILSRKPLLEHNQLPRYLGTLIVEVNGLVCNAHCQ